jgi:hypothetical protein
MTTALVARRDMTVIVPASLAVLLLDQRGKRRALVQVGIDDLDDRTAARRKSV